jgi:hypothetical protein
MRIALAPFTLKTGVTEEALLTASDEFEAAFVRQQEGILRRILVRDPNGGHADIVFFATAEAMEQVVAAEQDSEACAAFSSIMDDGEYTVFEVLKTYE